MIICSMVNPLIFLRLYCNNFLLYCRILLHCNSVDTRSKILMFCSEKYEKGSPNEQSTHLITFLADSAVEEVENGAADPESLILKAAKVHFFKINFEKFFF